MAMKIGKFDAIVYGWRNIYNGHMYPGYRGTDVDDDGYVSSSTSDQFWHAWEYGQLERCIIWRGTKSECISLEWWMLQWAKENDWDRFYNKQAGGGPNMDMSTVTEEMKEIGLNWMQGTDPASIIQEKFRSANRPLADKLSLRVKGKEIVDGVEVDVPAERMFVRITAKVSDIIKIKPNQVRHLNLIKDKLKAITERMRGDTGESRKWVNPVIILVKKDGSMLIIDGNHTINGASAAGWKEIDVIYINFSEFDYSMATVSVFGNVENHVELIKSPNSKEDCRFAIRNLFLEEKKLDPTLTIDDMSSIEWIEAIKETFKDLWSASQISANNKLAIRLMKEVMRDELAHFHKWSKVELAAVESDRRKEYGDSVGIIKHNTFAAPWNGVGGLLNLYGNKLKGKMTSGHLILHHLHLDDWDNRVKLIEKIEGSANAAGFPISWEILEAFEK